MIGYFMYLMNGCKMGMATFLLRAGESMMEYEDKQAETRGKMK